MLARLYKLDHLYGLLLTFGLALIIQGVFTNFYGSSGLPYRIPEELNGGINLGFMFLPKYRAWVIIASVAVCAATWYVIERTKLGSYLRAATENRALVQAFGINVPRMITLTYGFGVGLAAFAGVMAAPIYQVNPQMGANMIIVVFAVVVIGGMGSILGAIVTGFGLGIVEGLTKVFYPGSVEHGDLRDHGDRAADQARRALREGALGPWRASIPPSTGRARAGAAPASRGRSLVATGGDGGRAGRRAARRDLPGVPDEGAVLRALRLRVQPAARVRRPAVVRPRDVPRHAPATCPRTRRRCGASPPELAILAGTAASALLGLVTGALAIRRQGIYFAMITLALAQMIFFFCLQAPFTHGEDGIQAVPRGKLFGVLDLSNTLVMYYVVLAIFLAAFLLIFRVIHSPFGNVLKAIRENEPRAISLGYDAERYKLLAFILSATLAGLAGATKAIVFQLASLTDVHWTMSGEVVLMTLLGGMGTIFGPVVGAFAIIGLESYLAGFGQWVTVITGAIFVVCVLAFRRGIVGELGAWWAKRKP